jgi:hypothetical protein
LPGKLFCSLHVYVKGMWRKLRNEDCSVYWSCDISREIDGWDLRIFGGREYCLQNFHCNMWRSPLGRRGWACYSTQCVNINKALYINLVTVVSELILYRSQLHIHINLWNIVMKVQSILFSHCKEGICANCLE